MLHRSDDDTCDRDRQPEQPLPFACTELREGVHRARCPVAVVDVSENDGRRRIILEEVSRATTA